MQFQLFLADLEGKKFAPNFLAANFGVNLKYEAKNTAQDILVQSRTSQLKLTPPKYAFSLSFNNFYDFDTPYLHPRALNNSLFPCRMVWPTAYCLKLATKWLINALREEKSYRCRQFCIFLTTPNHTKKLLSTENSCPTTGSS